MRRGFLLSGGPPRVPAAGDPPPAATASAAGAPVVVYSDLPLLSPWNFANFLAWGALASRAELDDVMRLVYIEIHFGPHDPESMVVQGRTLTQRRCCQDPCARCDTGRGGYRFCWISPAWTWRGFVAWEAELRHVLETRCLDDAWRIPLSAADMRAAEGEDDPGPICNFQAVVDDDWWARVINLAMARQALHRANRGN
jgi:hypothetical protein